MTDSLAAAAPQGFFQIGAPGPRSGRRLRPAARRRRAGPVSAVMAAQAAGISSGVRSSWFTVTATTGRPEISSTAWIWVGRSCMRVTREAVVLLAGRGVLHDHHVGPAGGQQFEAAGVGRVHQAALALEDDHVGAVLLPAGPDRVLDLAGHEVVDQRIEDQRVARPLQPGGLAGAHQLGLAGRPARQASTSSQAVVRLPTAESVPSTATLKASTCSMRPSKKCSSDRGRRLAHVADRRAPCLAARPASSGSSLRKSCRPLSTFRPAARAASTSRAGLGRQAAPVRRQADHEMGGRTSGGLGQGQRRGQVGHDGNAVWPSVQHLAGVLAGPDRHR